jgi:hypothetical protein
MIKPYIETLKTFNKSLMENYISLLSEGEGKASLLTKQKVIATKIEISNIILLLT